MMTRVRAWFFALPSREQVLLVSACVLLVFWFTTLLVWRPITQQTERLRLRNHDNMANLAWVTEAAARIRSLRTDAPSSSDDSAPLSQQVNAMAQRLGLLINRLQPAGDREARIWIEDVPFGKAMQLLQLLESEGGVQTRSLVVSNADKTGVVNLQAALVRPE